MGLSSIWRLALQTVNQFDAGLLILRVIFGLFLAYHGYNKFFGAAGLAGPAQFFESMGMRWPRWQARLAATTEVASGLLLAAGLLTPLAAAGMIGLMLVAIVADHWKVGFFIFLPNQGWEYCASILTAAFVIGMVGPGRWSLDHAFGIEWNGWNGAIIAGVVGVGAALLQLAVSYRPRSTA
jgi:putative oxidoreductase